MKIAECISSKRWGGNWWRRLCCVHVWRKEESYRRGNIIIEKNRCVECGRGEILFLVFWD